MKKDDTIKPTEAPDGSNRPSSRDPEFARQMTFAEEIMHDDREVLQTLAK